jgi:hypothetical protein
MNLDLRDIENGTLLSYDFGIWDKGTKHFKDRKAAVAAAKRRLDSWARGDHD